MTHAITALPKYESYKDSGFEWLKEVPAHWDLLRLGSRFEERRTKVSDKDFAPLSVTKMGVVPQLESAAKTNDGDNRKLVKKGDFVINSRSDRKGSSGIAFQDGSVSLINTVLHPKEINPTYCNYLLKSNGFVEEFYRMGHGIVADLWTTRYDEMSSIILGIPTLEEQQAIAKFLDEKTVQIDEAIGIKDKQIALLKERKQIIIQNAVTKGLNPNAPMKDSGVDWIGDIPAHWNVKRLKFIGNAIIGLTYDPSNLCDEENGTLVLRASNLKDGEFVYGDKLNAYVNVKVSEKLTIKKDDVLICSRNGSRDLIGKCAIAAEHDAGVTFGAFTTVFRSEMNSYLIQILNSEIFRFLSGSFLTSTINQLTIGNLNSISVPLPPEKEQQEIRKYLEEERGRIDTVISAQQMQINNLKEYKASLINSAVTGKIKVI